MSFYGLADGSSFNSLFGRSSGGGGGMSTILSDYASIRNGSYHKLMKAYYGGNDKISPLVNSSTATTKESNKKLTSVQNAANDLKKAADDLLTKGSKSVFNKVDIKNEDGTTTKGYDTDAIFKKVSAFVDSYNSVLDSADDVTADSVTRQAVNMARVSKSNEKLLNSIGISITKDGDLKIDKEAFKKADMNTVKSMFNGTGSYAYQVSAKASMLEYNAQKEASKSNTYNKYGNYSYNNNFSYNAYF